MRERGELSYLSGARLIIYGRERYYGVFSGVEYAHLVAQYTATQLLQETYPISFLGIPLTELSFH